MFLLFFVGLPKAKFFFPRDVLCIKVNPTCVYIFFFIPKDQRERAQNSRYEGQKELGRVRACVRACACGREEKRERKTVEKHC